MHPPPCPYRRCRRFRSGSSSNRRRATAPLLLCRPREQANGAPRRRRRRRRKRRQFRYCQFARWHWLNAGRWRHAGRGFPRSSESLRCRARRRNPPAVPSPVAGPVSRVALGLCVTWPVWHRVSAATGWCGAWSLAFRRLRFLRTQFVSRMFQIPSCNYHCYIPSYIIIVYPSIFVWLYNFFYITHYIPFLCYNAQLHSIKSVISHRI